MIEKNKVLIGIIPETPKITPKEQIYVYVPAIAVDFTLSESSDRPVANKIITSALSKKADKEELDTKLDKIGPNTFGYTYCYTAKSDGTQDKVPVQTVVTLNAVVKRDGNGQIKVVETPVADDDAASKKYVNEKAKPLYEHTISFTYYFEEDLDFWGYEYLNVQVLSTKTADEIRNLSDDEFYKLFASHNVCSYTDWEGTVLVGNVVYVWKEDELNFNISFMLGGYDLLDFYSNEGYYIETREI